MINSESSSSFFAKAYNPFLQAGIVLGFSLFFMILAKLSNIAGLEMEQTFPWLITATFVMFFAIFNAVFSLSAADIDKYWGQSIFAFLVFTAISGGVAWLLSGVSLNEAGSYRWILTVLGIGYLIFLSMMSFMKRIVEFAQKEEWNHPRVNSKNRKKRIE